MKKVIGIDLGTTNSVVAFKKLYPEIIRDENNEELTRSCVSLINNELQVGRIAFNNITKHPEDVIVSIKRLIGMSIDDINIQEKIIDQHGELFSYYRYNITKKTLY